MKFNLNTILLIIIAGALLASTYFLFDNYKDKQAIKNALKNSEEVELKIAKNREVQSKAESEIGKELIQKGVIKTGKFKPVVYDWVFNEIINEPLMAVTSEEYLLTQNWLATIEAIRENKNTYKRYATEEEVKVAKEKLNMNSNESNDNVIKDADNAVEAAEKAIAAAEKALNK